MKFDLNAVKATAKTTWVTTKILGKKYAPVIWKLLAKNSHVLTW